MKWITRENIKVDRVACPWLIKRFIDPAGEFIFVPEAQLVEKTRSLGAIPFDVPGNPAIELNHRNGKCSFEVFLEKYRLDTDPGLMRLALIVHGADIPGDMHIAPESAGLYAMANGSTRTCATDEERLLKQFPVYDAFYEFCKGKT